MVASNRGRYLAPIALAATIAAAGLIVRDELASKHRAAPLQRADPAIVTHREGRKKFYVVRAGDSLSTISLKTGVSIQTLEALNPRINPYALQTGQRLKLRR